MDSIDKIEFRALDISEGVDSIFKLGEDGSISVKKDCIIHGAPVLHALKKAEARIEELEKVISQGMDLDDCSCGKCGHYMVKNRDDEIVKLKAELEEAREVIGFYGDRKNWGGFDFVPDDSSSLYCGNDGTEDIFRMQQGKRARKYLDKYKRGEK